jgi:signal transduction histidine kinase
MRTLASDVERSASRIHDLVGAVKRFTYMDRQQSAEVMELLPGLRDSVALLGHKARDKSVGIEVDVEPTLTRVKAIGGDLNQIWTNLIDNALDAVPESGHVTVTATREGDFAIVQFIDDGPGVPVDLSERIFDPFFTTKPMGEGTGLGLEMSRRLVRRNGGDITVESRPGRTVFSVTVPVATSE